MSIQIHEFDCKIYPYIIWVSIGLTDNEAKETFGVSRFDLRASGMVSDVYEYKGSYRRGALIRFPKIENITTETIAHEAAHAALYLFKFIGNNVNFDNQEPFAYLCGWIAKCIGEVKRNKQLTNQNN